MFAPKRVVPQLVPAIGKHPTFLSSKSAKNVALLVHACAPQKQHYQKISPPFFPEISPPFFPGVQRHPQNNNLEA
eukprot:6175051-Pleurochrysis_carterae.AAC.1